MPGESGTGAECTAAARAFSLRMQGGRIVTDCKAVYDMFVWLKKVSGQAAAAAGTFKQSCWERVAEAEVSWRLTGSRSCITMLRAGRLQTTAGSSACKWIATFRRLWA